MHGDGGQQFCLCISSELAARQLKLPAGYRRNLNHMCSIVGKEGAVIYSGTPQESFWRS
ncbi:hypothetical protein BJX62DRAFT_112674 [Aspergillus germanicus]